VTTTRAERKAETRRELILAAVRLSATRGFASLSLREICREAGLAPTAFYRHFKDMEDLGLALVDEVALSLRHLMRQARQRAEKGESRVRASVATFVEFIRRDAHLFRLLLGERSGSSPGFRKAVGKLEGTKLQRVPRGFDKSHPAAEYLRHRQFLAGREFPPEFAYHAKFYPGILDVMRQVAPLVRFLNEPLARN